MIFYGSISLRKGGATLQVDQSVVSWGEVTRNEARNINKYHLFAGSFRQMAMVFSPFWPDASCRIWLSVFWIWNLSWHDLVLRFRLPFPETPSFVNGTWKKMEHRKKRIGFCRRALNEDLVSFRFVSWGTLDSPKYTMTCVCRWTFLSPQSPLYNQDISNINIY